MYTILGTEYYSSFFRFAIIQPGQHCPKMTTRNIEVEMKEKQCMYFTLGNLPWTFSSLELI